MSQGNVHCGFAVYAVNLSQDFVCAHVFFFFSFFFFFFSFPVPTEGRAPPPAPPQKLLIHYGRERASATHPPL